MSQWSIDSHKISASLRILCRFYEDDEMIRQEAYIGDEIEVFDEKRFYYPNSDKPRTQTVVFKGILTYIGNKYIWLLADGKRKAIKRDVLIDTRGMMTEDTKHLSGVKRYFRLTKNNSQELRNAASLIFSVSRGWCPVLDKDEVAL